MLDEKGRNLISSLELQTKTGISRATMNNYIKMGLLPKPLIKKPVDKRSKAKRIGYFYESVLEVVNQVRLYKQQGRSMREITAGFIEKTNKQDKYTAIVTESNEIDVGKNDRLNVQQGIIHLGEPSFVHLAVLSACLYDSSRICAELPPGRYFNMLMQLRIIADEIVKKYPCTIKKNSGDHVLCYFFRDSDDSYLLNAISCAVRLKKSMVRINDQTEWKQAWPNNVFLNIAVCEGEEYVGVIPSSFADEIVTTGNSEYYAISLCEVGEPGSILTTKSLINKIGESEKPKIRYGIRRKMDDSAITIENIFSRITDLLPHDDSRFKKFKEIHQLVVTEIVDFDRETTNA